jgi:GntR family transcriptional regulator
MENIMSNTAKTNFQITPSSGVPIYRQMYDQVKIGIALGKFQSGHFLPSVRDVSAAFEINPMTVSKAYSLLEKEGVIEFIRGQGMRIPEQVKPGKSGKASNEAIAPLLHAVVNRAQQLSLDRDRVIEQLNHIWEGYRHE